MAGFVFVDSVGVGRGSLGSTVTRPACEKYVLGLAGTETEDRIDPGARPYAIYGIFPSSELEVSVPSSLPFGLLSKLP